VAGGAGGRPEGALGGGVAGVLVAADAGVVAEEVRLVRTAGLVSAARVVREVRGVASAGADVTGAPRGEAVVRARWTAGVPEAVLRWTAGRGAGAGACGWGVGRGVG
jgi:hypothetical protein